MDWDIAYSQESYVDEGVRHLLNREELRADQQRQRNYRARRRKGIVEQTKEESLRKLRIYLDTGLMP